MKTLDFYFDVYSPYAYLGFHRLLRLAHERACQVRYHPVDLPRLKKAAGNTGPANIEIPPKIRYLMVDLKRWAELYGLDFGEVPRARDYSRINQGVFYALDRNQVEEYVSAAYALVWGRGGSADDDGELEQLARSMAWDIEDFMAYIASGAAIERFDRSNLQAIERGVFGVPTVILEGQMWWGNDRLDLLDAFLASGNDETG